MLRSCTNLEHPVAAFFKVVVYRRVDDLEPLFVECGWP